MLDLVLDSVAAVSVLDLFFFLFLLSSAFPALHHTPVSDLESISLQHSPTVGA